MGTIERMKPACIASMLCITLILTLSGCGPGDADIPDDGRFPIEENESDACQDLADEVETKEVGEIDESIDITDIAIEKAITEQQVMVSQEEFESLLKEDAAIVLETPSEEPEPLYEVVEAYETKIPDELVLNLKYDAYPFGYDYLLVMTNTLNVRAGPSTESDIISKVYYFEKVNLEAVVKGQYLERYGTDLWYRIMWKDGDEIREGFVFSALAVPRTYQFEKMLERVEILKNEVESNTTAYISNYKYRNGRAPLYKGRTEDEFGTVRSQSAPAYYDLSDKTEFRYLEDGTLVSVLAENDAKTHYMVHMIGEDRDLWVPRRYVSFSNSIEELTQAVVVDRKNQNEGVFEYIEGKWNLISYIFATTGEEAQYKLPTSLGYWMAIHTQPQFIYLDDVTRKVAGYAPYTIRFNAGAYIHGVPVNYIVRDGRNVDPGMKEYLFTIGTVERSHKCVRNYTSHAKFLYEWIEIGKSAVIVIE